MDLMTLAAKIELDDSSFTKGLKDAEGASQKLAGKMSAMTVAMGQLAADVVKKTAAAIGNVVNGAIDGYADYQQLIGGVETLFKGSSSRVVKYAKESFKTTGLSANQYMETVTSFSASMLQGLKGNTEVAAEMANLAVTDMADNANKMGTDISSIQAAYQGFAKQNFTMLDNLKLGYGGTASEMVRLVNDSKILDHEISSLDGITFDQLVQAIHVVQTEMGITGTTAKEAASTISGSKASLEASWADFLTSIGGEKDQERLQESGDAFNQAFETYVIDNLAPQIQQTLENTPALIDAVTDAITSLPTKAINEMISSGMDILTAVVNGGADIGSWMIDGLVNLFQDVSADPSKIIELGTAVGDFIGSSIGDIVQSAPEILDGIITAGVSLAGGLVEGLFKGLFGADAEVSEITKQLQEDITDIDVNNAKATGILKYLDGLYEKFGSGATRTTEWITAQKELEEYLPAAGAVFQQYGSDIGGALKVLNQLNKSMRDNAIIAGQEKAIREMKELYGEQEARAGMAEAAVERAKSEKESQKAREAATAVALANEILSLNKNGANFYMGDLTDQMLSNARNTVETGASDKISELVTALENYYEQAGTKEEDKVWGKNDIDDILSPESIAGLAESYKQLDQTIEDQTEAARKAHEEAGKTWEQIILSTAAWERNMAARVEKSFSDAGNTIGDGTSKVGGALDGLAETIGSFSPYANYTPKATGMDTVPYDGFRAELHRGETVLTKSQSKAWHDGAGMGTREVVGAIQGMRNDLQNMRLVVGRKTFGRAVVDYGGRRLDNYIGQSESRYASGKGT